MKNFWRYILQIFLFAALLVVDHAPACAQEIVADPVTKPILVKDPVNKSVIDILPAKGLAEDIQVPEINVPTHPALRMTPDKSELIKLEKEAGTVVVGNPAHINIIADSASTLVVVPRAAGATYFTVLDKKGEVMMQRHVIVASPQKNYIRVRRTCTGDNEGCQPISVYYCPDMCHEILQTEQEETGDHAAEGGAEALADAQSGNDGEAEEGTTEE